MAVSSGLRKRLCAKPSHRIGSQQADTTLGVCAINGDMPFCPSCRAEFRQGFTRCNECDVPLVAELSLPGAGSEEVAGARRQALQIVSTSSDKGEATFIRDLLDNAGIPSVIEQTPTDQSGLFPGVNSGSVPVRLLVREEDYSAAKEILDQSQSPLLAVSQMEEQLMLFQNQLTAIANARPELTSDLDALVENIEHLRSELQRLVERLDSD